MPVYEVIRTETSSQWSLIEADTKEQAIEAAGYLEESSWRQCQDYESDYKISATVKPEDTVGKIIDKASDYLII